MSAGPPIRASDRDRERAASQLREHHALGRLDAEEFHDRLDKVYEAKTIAELDELTSDLPPVDLYPLPASSLPHRVNTDLPASSVLSQIETGIERLPSRAWGAAWASWLVVTLICVAVLLASGNPWPLAWAGTAGAVMAAGWAVRRARRHGG